MQKSERLFHIFWTENRLKDCNTCKSDLTVRLQDIPISDKLIASINTLKTAFTPLCSQITAPSTSFQKNFKNS